MPLGYRQDNQQDYQRDKQQDYQQDHLNKDLYLFQHLHKQRAKSNKNNREIAEMVSSTTQF
jgi:hypothetical protein